MQALPFLKDPAAPGPKPIYAVHGDDVYLRREAVAAIARVTLGDEAEAVARFAGEQAGLADVLDEVRTLPFLAPRRLAIVEGADPFVTRHRRELEAYAERPATSGVLVLVAKSWPGTTKLAKLVDKVGLAVDCKGPSERDLSGWLADLARSRHGARLDGDAARLLVELVGPEVGLLAAEVDKLATFVGDRKAIRPEDVARMVGAGRVEAIWTILDAATTGRGAEALGDLDRLLSSGESPVGLLSAAAKSLMKLYHAGQLRAARVDARDACQRAGIPTFAIEKALKQHAHLGPKRVARLPELLLKADLDLKGSSPLAPRVILERLLLELARGRED